ncbi:MAG: methyltransferase, partial [Actinobacteria bacterium]|nr:methyltransferase [Actinomycetota bacterium]
MTYADTWQNETEGQVSARQRSAEISSRTPSPTAVATLAVVVAATSAKAVVEVGTGSGLTGLSIIEGMAADGVLTTID